MQTPCASGYSAGDESALAKRSFLRSNEKRIEIRWRDLENYGHVNQAVYLTYAEEVLADWIQTKLGRRLWRSLRRLGIRGADAQRAKIPEGPASRAGFITARARLTHPRQEIEAESVTTLR